MGAPPLNWTQIARLGLVQASLGAIVVVMNSTINRVMVVELALPAFVPGALLALHYAVQMLRPRWGYGSDMGGRRTPWIMGGMAVLAIGGVLAAAATALTASHPVAGLSLAVFAFFLVGIGVGAAGTSLLVLLAARVAPDRRAAAATMVWIMLIAGFAVTASVSGRFLDPFSYERLVLVTAIVAVLAFLLALAAVSGVEGHAPPAASTPAEPRPAFAEALRAVWDDRSARGFAVFVFVSMLAYKAQELILEPYAGFIFKLTPGATTKLAGDQHAGVLAGMLFMAVLATWARGRFGSLRTWTVAGCVASAAALVAIAWGGFAGPGWPLRTWVVMLGIANGIFAVSAIGAMMGLASGGSRAHQGTRMGVFGAAQAVAFGAGGLLGALGADMARRLLGDPVLAYATVFMAEACLFLIAAVLGYRLEAGAAPHSKGRGAQPVPLWSGAPARGTR